MKKFLIFAISGGLSLGAQAAGPLSESLLLLAGHGYGLAQQRGLSSGYPLRERYHPARGHGPAGSPALWEAYPYQVRDQTHTTRTRPRDGRPAPGPAHSWNAYPDCPC